MFRIPESKRPQDGRPCFGPGKRVISVGWHSQGGLLRKFDVFRNSRGKLKCAKRGWSWPAFFFAPFWALFCGLWLVAFIFIPVELVLSAVGQALIGMQASGTSAEALVVLAYLALAVGMRMYFGLCGNALKRGKWEGRGYSLMYSVEAESANVAIAMAREAEPVAVAPAVAAPAAPPVGADIIEKARARLQRELLQIEGRTDLTPDQKIDRVITIFSTVCAAIAIQPIPFADIFILTPLQAFMGARLSAIRGVPITEAESSDLMKEIMGVVGMGLIAQQVGIAAAKLFFPVVGGIATIPVVFGMTYAIGKVMDFYLVGKAAGRTPSAAELKDAWKDASARGQAEGKIRQTEIERGEGNREVLNAESLSSGPQAKSEPVVNAPMQAVYDTSHPAPLDKMAGSPVGHGTSEPAVPVDEAPVVIQPSRTGEARGVEVASRHADVVKPLTSQGDNVPISEGLNQIAFKIANELVEVIRTEDALWWFVMEQFDRLRSSKRGAKLLEAFPIQLREVEYRWGRFEPFNYQPDNPGVAYLKAQVEPALIERFGHELAELTVAHAFTQYCLNYLPVIQPVRRKYAAHFRDELRSQGHQPLAERWDEVLNSLEHV